MKVTKLNYMNGYGTPYSFAEIKNLLYPLTIYVDEDASNCKLSYIHGIGALSGIDDADKKLVINELLRGCKGSVVINTIRESVTDFISKNYPTYYYNKVPVGYTNGYQYHICIKNTININGTCRNPEKSVGTIDKAAIRTKLLKVLKANKRKTDYVNEFIKSL